MNGTALTRVDLQQQRRRNRLMLVALIAFAFGVFGFSLHHIRAEWSAAQTVTVP